MKLLAVASEAFEAMPLVKSGAELKVLRWPIRFARQARLNDVTLFAVAHGPGPRLAQEAIDMATRHAGPFDAAISFGLCGALDSALPLNAICTATAVGDGATIWPAIAVPGATPVRLLSVDRFLDDPKEKRDWARRGFGAVEMEAAAVAKYAAANRIPFYAVKIVSDRADESFAIDFNRYRDAAGRFQRARIALAALAHPILYAPDLIRMASRGPAASATLGVFLAHARF